MTDRHQSTNSYGESTVEEDIPDTIVDAMITSGNDLQVRETWISPVTTAAMLSVPRVVGAILTSAEMIGGSPDNMVAARRICLRILAYMPANLRIPVIMRVARINPEAIDNLLLGRLNEEDEVLRFNFMNSIGVFARHSLISEVMSIERMDRVLNSIEESRNPKKTRNKDGD